MSKKNKIVLILVALVVAVVMLVAILAVSEDKVAVNVRPIEKKTVVQTVQASGKVEPVLKVEISANVSGEIVDLPVREGQEVKRGDLLCVLDSTRYKANREQIYAAKAVAEAQARLADANLEQAERTFRRTVQLHKQGLISDEEMEQARTKVDVLKAQAKAAHDQIAQASANLRLAGDELSKTILRSPIDGIVISLQKEAGEIVMGSQFTRDIIMTVADMSSMETVVEVDENDMRDLELGQSAEVGVDAFPKDRFVGLVTQIANSAKVKGLGTQEQTTGFEVTVTLSGDVSKIRPGMSATAEISTATHENVLAAPIQCVTMRDPEADPKKPVAMVRSDRLKEVVFKVEDARAKMTPIRTGIASEFDIEIEGDGVQEGRQIVCGPYKTLNKDLKNGDLLKIEEETTLAGGTPEK